MNEIYNFCYELNNLNEQDIEYPLNRYIIINKILKEFEVNNNYSNDNVINIVLNEINSIDIKLNIYYKLLKSLYSNSNNNSSVLNIINSILDYISTTCSNTTIASILFNHFHIYCILNKCIQFNNNNNNNNLIFYKIIKILNNNNQIINKLINKCTKSQFLANDNDEEDSEEGYSHYSILNKILKLNLNCFKYLSKQQQQQKEKEEEQNEEEKEIVYKYLENLIKLVFENKILYNLIKLNSLAIAVINNNNNNNNNQLDINSLFFKSKTGSSILLCKIYKLVLEVLKLILQLPIIPNQIINLITTTTKEEEEEEEENKNEIIKKLIYLFFNQDDIAIDTINLLLQIYIIIVTVSTTTTTTTTNRINFLNFKNLILNQLNPHKIFYFFISRICFYDHLTLIDMLISNETNFLNYFLNYLKLIINQDEKSIKELINKMVLEDYDDQDDEDNEDNEGDEEQEEYENKFIKCLKSLYDTIEISMNNNSFPYNPRILLSRLDSTVRILEDDV